MTATVSFKEPLYLFSESGYQPKIQVEKKGFEEASCRIWSTGGSTGTASRTPDRAIKRFLRKASLTRGDTADFFSRTEELYWAEGEEGIKEYEITIHDDDIVGEKPEYFYITIRPGEGTKVGLWRCHCFILDGDGSSFFNKYVIPPYNLKQADELPIPVGVPNIRPFGLAIADTNGNEYPPELLGNMFTDPGFFRVARNMPQPLMMNVCMLQDLGAFKMFSGEFHIENIDIPSMESVRRYNQMENMQYSEYSHVFLTLPFSNPTEMAIPLVLSASQFWKFRDMHTEEKEESVNGSMTALLLPKSNRVMFEFAKGTWKTTLCGSWTENNPPTFKPSMHIFIGGLVPNA